MDVMDCTDCRSCGPSLVPIGVRPKLGLNVAFPTRLRPHDLRVDVCPARARGRLATGCDGTSFDGSDAVTLTNRFAELSWRRQQPEEGFR